MAETNPNVTDDIIEDVLQENNFTILSVEQDPEKPITYMEINHNLHPEENIQILVIGKEENGEETMEMQFNGPDVWTDEEAKGVLQEVMDTLIDIIERAVETDVFQEMTGQNQESGSGSSSGSN